MKTMIAAIGLSALTYFAGGTYWVDGALVQVGSEQVPAQLAQYFASLIAFVVPFILTRISLPTWARNAVVSVCAAIIRHYEGQVPVPPTPEPGPIPDETPISRILSWLFERFLKEGASKADLAALTELAQRKACGVHK